MESYYIFVRNFPSHFKSKRLKKMSEHEIDFEGDNYILACQWIENERQKGINMIFYVEARSTVSYSTRDAAFYLKREGNTYILLGRRLKHGICLCCCCPEHDKYELRFKTLPMGDTNTSATRNGSKITYRRVLRNLKATHMECKKHGKERWWSTREIGDLDWLERLTGVRHGNGVCVVERCWRMCKDGAERCEVHLSNPSEVEKENGD